MNRDQIKGRFEIIIGEFKERFGQLLHNPALEAQGRREKLVGSACAHYGDAKAGVIRRVQRLGN
jgi:uncharacterized protein YjbJ (UPF0337 family)